MPAVLYNENITITCPYVNASGSDSGSNTGNDNYYHINFDTNDTYDKTTYSFNLNDNNIEFSCDSDIKCCELFEGSKLCGADSMIVSMNSVVNLYAEYMTKDCNGDSDSSVKLFITCPGHPPVGYMFRCVQNGYYSHQPCLTMDDEVLFCAII